MQNTETLFAVIVYTVHIMVLTEIRNNKIYFYSNICDGDNFYYDPPANYKAGGVGFPQKEPVSTRDYTLHSDSTM